MSDDDIQKAKEAAQAATHLARKIAESLPPRHDDRALRTALREEAAHMRGTAASLRREADSGRNIRQSAESKHARADVLDSCARTLDRLADTGTP